MAIRVKETARKARFPVFSVAFACQYFSEKSGEERNFFQKKHEPWERRDKRKAEGGVGHGRGTDAAALRHGHESGGIRSAILLSPEDSRGYRGEECYGLLPIFHKKKPHRPGNTVRLPTGDGAKGKRRGEGGAAVSLAGIIRRGAPSCRGAQYARRAPGRH